MNPEATLDCEEEEEEILVYVEFDESVNIDKYRSIHVLGINEKNPIIQADDTFFTGKFINPLGTYMFFEEDPSPKSEDSLFDKLPEANLKYVFKTNKYMSMEHAYVSPKEGGDQVLRRIDEPTDDVKAVKFSSTEEALKMFRSVLLPNPDPSVMESSQPSMECSNTKDDKIEAMET